MLIFIHPNETDSHPGVDFRTRNLRVDSTVYTIQLWDTAGQEKWVMAFLDWPIFLLNLKWHSTLIEQITQLDNQSENIEFRCSEDDVWANLLR